MFYDNFYSLCVARGVKPCRAATEIGINKSALTYWKMEGGIPQSADTLCKIADYFDTSVDYLLGRSDDNGTCTAVAAPVPESVDDITALLFRETKQAADMVDCCRKKYGTYDHMTDRAVAAYGALYTLIEKAGLDDAYRNTCKLRR